jgi:hypothetical protein
MVKKTSRPRAGAGEQTCEIKSAARGSANEAGRRQKDMNASMSGGRGGMGEPRGELLLENYLPESGRSNFYPSGEGKMWRP